MSDTLAQKPKISKGAAILSLVMIMIVGVVSNYIYVLGVYMDPLHDANGWSRNSIALAYSAAIFCEIPAYVIGGWLSKKFGMKKILVISGILYGLAILVSGLTPWVSVFVISQGFIASLAMFGVYIATLALINVLFPKNKGLVIGILYGVQAFGGAAMAPIATVFIDHFNVMMALVIQGAIFTVIMFIGCMLVTDPTKGNVKLAEIQEQMDKEELAEVQEGKSKDELPTMGWKRAFIHPAFWFFFISLVFVQLFGNVLVTDVPYIAETVFGIGNDESAWAISLFSITAGVGGIVIGFMSDKIGPYKSTMILGIADGILILLLVFAGHDSWMFFVIICAIQGFTYNGMTTLNPVMIMDSYSDKDFGVVMGGMAVAYTIVGVVGPQIGLELPFLPLIIVSGVLSIIGGIFAKFSAKSLNKYYEKTGSACRVR